MPYSLVPVSVTLDDLKGNGAGRAKNADTLELESAITEFVSGKADLAGIPFEGDAKPFRLKVYNIIRGMKAAKTLAHDVFLTVNDREPNTLILSKTSLRGTAGAPKATRAKRTTKKP